MKAEGRVARLLFALHLLASSTIFVGAFSPVKNPELFAESLPRLVAGSSDTESKNFFKRGDWCENDVQLPTFQVPEHYDLAIHPTFSDDVFFNEGVVQIELQITEVTDFLVIHALLLDILSIELTSPLIPIGLSPENVRRQEELQYTIMEFERDLPPGEYTLTIHFEAEISTDLFGFYRSDYTDQNGDTKWMGLTQFAAARARQAFPCMDEPALKAEFSLTIITNFSTVLANMPEISRRPYHDPESGMATGEEIVEFQRSVLMSPYLVAWVVCDFEATESAVADGYITTTVWTQPGQTSQGIFVRDVAVSTLEHFNERYGIPYALPKCDLIAIPDFYFGAMENWGLITYADSAILFDENVHPTSRKDSIARTTSHEVAHQWFGNLVTLDWWFDVWLNEGFATFMAPFGVDATFPDWNELVAFQRVLNTAMNADSLPNSGAVAREFNTPSELDSVYNTIAYQKGASVLHMFSNLINNFAPGMDTPFWDGIRMYLRTYQFASATTEQFLDLMDEFSNLPVPLPEVAFSWVMSPGFPVIQFLQIGVSSEYTITQTRYLRTVNPDGASGVYYIPFSYQLQNETTSEYFFSFFEGVGELVWNPASGWIHGNIARTGFYRVQHTPAMWENIFTVLENDVDSFLTEERAGILHDLFAFALAPQDSEFFTSANVVRALRATSYMNNAMETDYIPWWAVLNGLDSLSRYLIDRNPTQTDNYKEFLHLLVSPVEQLIGWDVDSNNHDEALLREQLVNFAVRNGLPEARITASSLFRSFVTSGVLPHQDVVSSMFIGAVNDGFEDMYQIYLEISDTAPGLATQILDGLTYSQNPEQIDQLLEAALNGPIESSLTISVISRAAQNTRSSLQVFEFVLQHWPELCSRYCDTSGAMSTLFNAIIGFLNTQNEVNIAAYFFLDPSTPMGDTQLTMNAYLNAQNQAYDNISWMNANRDAINEFLNSYLPKARFGKE